MTEARVRDRDVSGLSPIFAVASSAMFKAVLWRLRTAFEKFKQASGAPIYSLLEVRPSVWTSYQMILRIVKSDRDPIRIAPEVGACSVSKRVPSVSTFGQMRL